MSKAAANFLLNKKKNKIFSTQVQLNGNECHAHCPLNCQHQLTKARAGEGGKTQKANKKIEHDSLTTKKKNTLKFKCF